jgi:hypothetical protein
VEAAFSPEIPSIDTMTRFIARAVLVLTCCALLAEPYRYADVSSDELNSALKKLSGPFAAVSTATELYSIPPATNVSPKTNGWLIYLHL